MITYILTGVAFMFCVEFLLSKEIFKKHVPTRLGNKERIIGILTWPVLIVIFFYNFFKQLSK